MQKIKCKISIDNTKTFLCVVSFRNYLQQAFNIQLKMTVNTLSYLCMLKNNKKKTNQHVLDFSI